MLHILDNHDWCLGENVMLDGSVTLQIYVQLNPFAGAATIHGASLQIKPSKRIYETESLSGCAKRIVEAWPCLLIEAMN